MRRLSLLSYVFTLILFFSACGPDLIAPQNSEETPGTSSSESDRRETLSVVDDWAIQTQNIEPAAIAAAEHDLVVVDVSRNGSFTQAFTADEVRLMKGEGANKKILLAYVSIGEAESYRDYFDVNAPYVDGQNPVWPDNYKVQYWTPEWKAIVTAYLDGVLAAGYDGAFFDLIDAYEYYEDGLADGVERPSAPQEMADFVMYLADYARSFDPDFLILPLNGSGILDKIANPDAYLNLIDGLCVEDIFYFGTLDTDNHLNPQQDVLQNLRHFTDRGKAIFSIEYLNDSKTIETYFLSAISRNFIPYNAPRNLDMLLSSHGFEDK